MLAEREGHEKLADSLDPTRASRWRERMSTDEQQRFERIAGDALVALGYEVHTDQGPNRQGHRLPARLRAAAACCTRPLLWKQSVVCWLPAILLLSDRMGLPLARRLHARAVETIRDDVRARDSRPRT
ncbi:MAG: hypothetical protein U5K33_04835 [Halofilum sp. (in: g-proteobacteria)]|nr:hypothetical protein [Halofilum sp. (in: g-proteobacteria)]